MVYAFLLATAFVLDKSFSNSLHISRTHFLRPPVLHCAFCSIHLIAFHREDQSEKNSYDSFHGRPLLINAVSQKGSACSSKILKLVSRAHWLQVNNSDDGK